MENFDIAKFLRENQLGSYGILNHYVDLKPLKEEDDTTEVELNTEIPYEGPEHKLAGDGTEFEQAETVSEQIPGDDTRMMDLGGNLIEQGIIRLIDDGFEAEDILELCKMLVNDQYGAKAAGFKFEQIEEASTELADFADAVGVAAKSGVSKDRLHKVVDMSYPDDIEEGEVDEEWYPHDEDSLEKGRAKIIKKK